VGSEVDSLSPATAGSLSLACNAAGLRVAAASVTFSVDAATSSDAKERGKDTVMEDKVVVTVCKGSDVGTARRSMGGDDDGGGTARRSMGGDRGPAPFVRRRRTKLDVPRGDMRRTVDDE